MGWYTQFISKFWRCEGSLPWFLTHNPKKARLSSSKSCSCELPWGGIPRDEFSKFLPAYVPRLPQISTCSSAHGTVHVLCDGGNFWIFGCLYSLKLSWWVVENGCETHWNTYSLVHSLVLHWICIRAGDNHQKQTFLVLSLCLNINSVRVSFVTATVADRYCPTNWSVQTKPAPALFWGMDMCR